MGLLATRSLSDLGEESGIRRLAAGAAVTGLDEAPGSDNPCDGYDNDLDGDVDEGCYCEAGDVQPCYAGDPALAGKGLCHFGEQSCVAVGGDFALGEWSACVGSGEPMNEICDNDVDEDCDGVVAECGPTRDPANP